MPGPCRGGAARSSRARLPSPGRRRSRSRSRCRCRSLPRRPAAGTPLAHRPRPLPLLPFFCQPSEPVSASLGCAGRGVRAPSRPAGAEPAAALPGTRRKSSALPEGWAVPPRPQCRSRALAARSRPVPSRAEPSRAEPCRAAPPVAERAWPCRALNSPGAGPPSPARPGPAQQAARGRCQDPPVGRERSGQPRWLRWAGAGDRRAAAPVLGEEGPPPARREPAGSGECRSRTVTAERQKRPEDLHW